MTADIFYGTDCEARIGAMADKDTDPEDWFYLEFITLTLNSTRERRDRPKIGRTRHNPLDPTKPIPGFYRFGAELVIDADANMLPRILRCCLGAPTTTGPATLIYTHKWASGVETPQYMALQIKTADSPDIRIFRGIVLSAISTDVTSEQTQENNINLSLRGLSRERDNDWVGDDPAGALAAEAPMSGATFRVNDVAAEAVLRCSWSWDRNLAEDAFLTAFPGLDGLRPGGGSKHTGSAQFRAVGAAYDTLEEDDTVFSAILRYDGLIADNDIIFEHQQAMLDAPPLSIGPGLIERTISWNGHQISNKSASLVTVKNTTASYA